MKRLILFILFSLSLLSLTACDDGIVGIKDRWVRPGVQGGNTAAYLVIQNTTTEDIAMIDAKTDTAMMVELHRSSMVDGVMKMEQQQNISIPSKSETELKPGDYHIMIMNLKNDLSPGDVVDITMIFDNGVEITLPFDVREP